MPGLPRPHAAVELRIAWARSTFSHQAAGLVQDVDKIRSDIYHASKNRLNLYLWQNMERVKICKNGFAFAFLEKVEIHCEMRRLARQLSSASKVPDKITSPGTFAFHVNNSEEVACRLEPVGDAVRNFAQPTVL